jgi:hypothetical protein
VLLALLASVLIIFGAPYIGELRGALQSSFPEQYRWIIGGIVATATFAAIGAALARVRRWPLDSPRSGPSAGSGSATRYGLIGAGVIISAAYARAVSSGNPDVDLVEAFHFVEYGLLAYLFYRAWWGRRDVSGLVFAACAALAVGVADEWVQWFVPGRVGEIHDVWLNAVAISCGLLFSTAIHPPVSLQQPTRPSARLAASASVVALVFAVTTFLSVVHLGHEVRSDATGAFRSRYDASALEAAASTRADLWRVAPPPRRGLAREDHYLSEGQWHIQRRNRAITEGDLSAAWNENAILERFYAPVLDRGDRWSDGQRAEIAQHARTSTPTAYVSDAEPYPIYATRARTVWAAAAVLAAVIVSLWRPRKAPATSPV